MNARPIPRARERLPRTLVAVGLARPRATLGLWLALCFAATPGVLRLSVETSAESALDRRHAAWAFYQRSLDLFGGDEIVVLSATGEPYSPSLLRAVASWSEELEALDGVRRVDSLTTHPVIRVDEDGVLQLDPATGPTGRPTGVDGADVRARVLHDRILPRSLVSDDGGTLAINLVLDADASDHYERVLAATASAAASAPAGVEATHVSGVPVFEHETSLHTRRELLRFTPIALLVIGGLLTVVFRSPRAAAFLIATGGCGSWMMLAAIGAVGVPLSFTMVILPPVLIALAAAYGMHLVTAAARPRSGDAAALERALGAVATPVALSGLTTAIGFLATGAVGIDAVRYVGVFGALGVLFVIAFVLTGLPALIATWPLPDAAPRGLAHLEALADRLAALAHRAPRRSFAAWAVVAAAAGLGLGSVHVDTDATRWFRSGSAVRDDYEAIRRDLSGISPVNVVVEIDDGGPFESVLDPAVLGAIDGLSTHLESLDDVGKSVSLADPLRQIHAGFAPVGGGPLPPTRAASEQYLLLLESVEQIDDLVTSERRHANVMLRVDDNGSAQLLAVGEEAARWWDENGPDGTRARATGIMYEFARSQDAITWGQAVGLSGAIASIGVLLLLAFGRIATAAATLLPNVVPLLVVYGAMGVLGVPLDAGTVFVGSLALGIAVDDTVHLASAYFDATTNEPDRERGPLALALRRVTPTITYTTGIVGLGFCLLGLSDFTLVRNLGLLMTSVMTVCLLADLLLLPALLVQTDGKHVRNSAP